jgi:3-phosphoglycerate kinase
MDMLNFVSKAFRGWFEIILWLCLIGFIIIGGVVGHLVNSYNDNYIFLGIIIGGIVGFLFIVLSGGLVANFLNMVDNIEEQNKLLKMFLKHNKISIGEIVSEDLENVEKKQIIEEYKIGEKLCNICGKNFNQNLKECPKCGGKDFSML